VVGIQGPSWLSAAEALPSELALGGRSWRVPALKRREGKTPAGRVGGQAMFLADTWRASMFDLEPTAKSLIGRLQVFPIRIHAPASPQN